MTLIALLGDLCRPKQWKILAKSQMVATGYPVYGANGKIGCADSYTHDRPTILIGCRGSCGSVHVTEPKSYANGNAMALDDLDESRVVLPYLVHFCRARGFADVITGTSQPQIIRQRLVSVQVPLPPLEEQRRIAAILDQADALHAKRREVLAHLDDLTQSIFLDMFGDPVANPMGWARRPIRDWGDVVTGTTPPREDPKNYGPGIEWIKSDNLAASTVATRAVETLSAQGRKIARVVPRGSVLVTCIAGSPASIGKAAIVDREVAFNQQINALVPSEADPRFIHAQLRAGQRLVQNQSSGGMKGLVSKSRFASIELLDPPKGMQRQFVEQSKDIERIRGAGDAADTATRELCEALQQRAFSGRF